MREAATVLTLFILALLNQSCKQMKEPDLILTNGKVLAVDDKFSVCEAVAISGNRIVAVGSTSEIKRSAGNHTRVIDLNGKCVVPGLIDAHLHPESASLSELDEQIPDIHDISQLLSWIKQEVARKGKNSWIIMPKFFPTRLAEMRQPALEELDKAAPENPVFLNGSFGGMINSAAMRASGIDSHTSNPNLLKDHATGALTGFIRSSAFTLLKTPVERTISEEERRRALLNMIKRYNEYGFTTLWSGTGSPLTINMYHELAEKKLLTARICQNILIPVKKPFTKSSVDSLISGYQIKTGDGDEWVRVGSMKLFLDGGILTGTAYMEEPWGTKASGIFGIEDPAYRGELNFTKEELKIIVSVANEHGWNFTAHATGEGAVDELLEVYSEVDKEKPLKGRMFSVIHGNFFNPTAIAIMSKLGICANLQPAWFYKDTEAMDSILGREKVRIFHPYRSLADAGVLINGGSDNMVKWDATTSINPYNPFLAIYSMVTRKTERGNIFHPEQALTREEALTAYTINNAMAMGEVSLKGSIEPGKLADLAILSEDIMTCPAESIKDIKAVMTILDGKIVYER
jgi:predicted amidohydrolase YtcJ